MVTVKFNFAIRLKIFINTVLGEKHFVDNWVKLNKDWLLYNIRKLLLSIFLACDDGIIVK